MSFEFFMQFCLEQNFVGNHIVKISVIFCHTYILREINFWDTKSSTNCHLDIFEALNLDFDDFLHF